jgi:hypothetical protein
MDQRTLRQDNVRRVLAACKAVGEADHEGAEALLTFDTEDELLQFTLRTLDFCWVLLQEIDSNVDDLVGGIIEASDELLDDGW